ncbi:glutamate synthase subunit alpha, partial [Halovenus rubra]
MTHNGMSSGEDSLVDATRSRSNCGVGVVMDLDGDGGSRIVDESLQVLENMEHRGTTGAEEATGDGAGIMLRIPHEFFSAVVDADLPSTGNYAVGTLFFPCDDEARHRLKLLVEDALVEEGLEVRTWRSVPTDNSRLGDTAIESEPHVEQVFIVPRDESTDTGLTADEFDRRLYVARRVVENRVDTKQPPGYEQCYIVSLDRKTVIYKGLLKASQLATYYPDLTDERMRSVFAMVHARFSTNTLGAWHLAHPFRTMVHNGEFNTIRGNINWMRSRETDLAHDAFGDDIEKIKPIIDDPDQSDTASLDNVLELLLEGGRSLPHALRMLIPEAWRGDETAIDEKRQEFYEYHASLIEPWDGPALVVGTDGERVGAVLDRNGLRPCRYDLLSDDTLVMASEVGVLPYDESEIVERGRLQPGQCFVADPTEGRIVPDADVFDEITDEQYGTWVADEQVQLDDQTQADTEPQASNTIRAKQAMFGYTYDVRVYPQSISIVSRRSREIGCVDRCNRRTNVSRR